MASPRSALLIASNEVCYNPRLLKLADVLRARGVDVSVFSPVVGLADPALYDACVASRPWTVRSADISKRTWRSSLAWAVTSAVSRASGLAWRAGARAGFHLVLNRALLLFPWRGRRFDLVAVNLVDNLPFAASIRRRHGGVLLYDSQELFSGEAATMARVDKAEWVAEAERRFIGDADVVTTTTQALADRLTLQFGLRRPALRVRNAPLSAPANAVHEAPTERNHDEPLRLVWHGFAVNLRGRGVDLLLEAVSRCRQPIQLTLQGRLDEQQRREITAACDRLDISDRVRFVPPAHPEAVPASLAGYDVGVIAETGVDENQRLTSSNKLFDYLHAGLAVIAPDLPGMAETLAAEAVGAMYRTNDAADLALAIDRLAADRGLCQAFRAASLRAASRITWEADFDPVWAEVQAAFSRAGQLAPAAGLHEARL